MMHFDARPPARVPSPPLACSKCGAPIQANEPIYALVPGVARRLAPGATDVVPMFPQRIDAEAFQHRTCPGENP